MTTPADAVPAPAPADAGLRRELSTLDATMINIGSMIGSGIFIAPASVAALLFSPAQAIGVWVIAGVVSLFGALSVAELGVRLPHAGGQYVYLKEAYGPLVGFLYGWTAFLVINTASIAAVAVTFASYTTNLTGGGPAAMKGLAVGSVLFLTIINCFGIKLGALVQNVFTTGKIAIIAGLAALPFIIGFPAPAAEAAAAPSSGMLAAFAMALIPALFAYDGWIEITYVAGEVRDPRRAIPRSLWLGTAVVVALYVGMNYSLLTLLGFSRAAQSPLVAADAATVLFGSIGSSVIAAAVAVSTFGANNGFIFTCPRIYYAMAKEGLFFRWIGQLHPRTNTPVASLAAQGVLSTVLILSGTFDQLAAYVVFASFLFYGMSAGAVIILRRRQPQGPEAFRVWGYPFTVILFILFALFLTAAMIVGDLASALVGLGIVVSGIPMYYYWRTRQ